MNNKYLYVVMSAVMVTIAYYLVHMPYFANATGGITDAMWYATILAVGLGAGSTGGSDAISILVEGIKGYVGTAINLAILGAVAHIIISMGLNGGAFDAMAIVQAAATYVVAGLMVNLVLSYLKKAA